MVDDGLIRTAAQRSAAAAALVLDRVDFGFPSGAEIDAALGSRQGGLKAAFANPAAQPLSAEHLAKAQLDGRDCDLGHQMIVVRA